MGNILDLTGSKSQLVPCQDPPDTGSDLLSWQRTSVNKCYLKTSTDVLAKEVNFKKQEFSFGFSDLSRFCSEGHKSSCLITAVPQKVVGAAVALRLTETSSPSWSGVFGECRL